VREPAATPVTVRLGHRPRLAVWKFASCDGCQLSLLDCERDLLAVAEAVDIVSFPEASSDMGTGPYDISLVEGSITTPHDLERIQQVRDESTLVVTIGACATAGGIQALRNLADLGDVAAAVYPSPEQLDVLATSTPIADHVAVDAELRGCPIDRGQLVELVNALLNGRPPRVATTSVCTECKARGQRCVMVAGGLPCLGPLTQAGCGALCPAYHRGCYGCFGPAETANVTSLVDWFSHLGRSPEEVRRLLAGLNVWAPQWREEVLAHVAPR
jgi:coenzyme F420-reducing hydrogenase gamma subunit